MPDYKKLHDMVSHRVTFEYDTGAKVTGYVAWVAPAEGPVTYVVLSRAQVLDAQNNLVARFEELPIVPNNLVGFRVTEGAL
jgi:hypothetical protein